MPILDIPSGQIAYDEQGDPAGVPLFLLPGGAHDRHDYDELRGHLPERLRSIAIDWPAHGDSPPCQAPLTAMHLADITEEAVAQLAPEGAVVLGNSVGGFSAARLAIRRPELVKGLVIVDGGGFAGLPPHARAFCSLMAKPRFLRAVYPAFSKRYMRSRTSADRRAQAVGVATTRKDPGLKAISELWRSFSAPEHDLREEAPSISAPTLVIWGRHDPVISLRVGRRINRLVPDSKLVVIDSGHVPHTTDPANFSSHLLQFLGRLPLGY